ERHLPVAGHHGPIAVTYRQNRRAVKHRLFLTLVGCGSECQENRSTPARQGTQKPPRTRRTHKEMEGRQFLQRFRGIRRDNRGEVEPLSGKLVAFGILMTPRQMLGGVVLAMFVTACMGTSISAQNRRRGEEGGGGAGTAAVPRPSSPAPAPAPAAPPAP